jgi:ABC-2 type transport system permease protein
MGIGLIVAAIYCVDALYGERRDRSILLWKSLPVSDAMTVLAKLTIPVLVLPVIIWALTVAVQLVLLLLSTAVLTAHGGSVGPLWTQLHLARDSAGLLYHLVALHGISTVPVYAWLLLVSAWATRAPFAWAILPPAAIMLFERVAFGTTRVAHLLANTLGGGASAPPPPPGATLMESMNAVPLTRLLAAPGLWIGFAIAAVFVVGTVRLRRSAQAI